MIENLTPVEQRRPPAVEQPRPPAGGPGRAVGDGRIFQRWRPLKLIIVAAVVLIVLLAVIAGWMQKWLWMQQLGYTGVFWTILSVKWALSCAAFVVAFLYLWINLRFAARNGATFRAGNLTSASTVAPKRDIQIPPTVLKTGHGRGRCCRRSVLCAHLLRAMGYVSPLSLWRILWIARSSLRGRCRVLSVPSPLL